MGYVQIQKHVQGQKGRGAKLTFELRQLVSTMGSPNPTFCSLEWKIHFLETQSADPSLFCSKYVGDNDHSILARN
jgi:hypothetical protein